MRVNATPTLLLLALLLPGLALALPPPEGPLPVVLQGPVAADRTIEGVTVLLAGDLEVAPGATLTLRGANVTVLALDDRPITVTIRGGGALVLEPGTDALTSAPAETRVRSVAAPFDLAVEPAGQLRVRDAVVRDARIALHGAGDFDGARLNLSAGGVKADGVLTIRNGTLEASPDALVDVVAGTADLDGVLLQHAGAEAFRAQAGSVVRLAHATIAGASSYGVSLWGAEATVEGNDFARAADYALRADGTHLTFRGNHVANHCAVFLNDGSWGLVEGNDLAITNHGVTVRASGAVVVVNNTIAGGSQGIAFVDSLPGVAANNTVGGNNVGVLVRRGGAALDRNTFLDNGIGVLVTDEADPDGVVLRDNAFAGNAWAARNDRAAVQDARWNWWADPAGPGPAQPLAGPWDAAPWLTAAP